MIKNEVASRVLYKENPLVADHPVKGSQVTILALETDGACLVGESLVEWDEARKKNVTPTMFDHYERRSCSATEAAKLVEGKIAKLISDGYVFEVIPNMRHFMNTGQLTYEVYEHPST